jgi:hypothetical protein
VTAKQSRVTEPVACFWISRSLSTRDGVTQNVERRKGKALHGKSGESGRYATNGSTPGSRLKTRLSRRVISKPDDDDDLCDKGDARSMGPWHSFNTGDRVQAKYLASSSGGSSSGWYEGVITDLRLLNGIARCSIQYSDGDLERDVLPKYIRPVKGRGENDAMNQPAWLPAQYALIATRKAISTGGSFPIADADPANPIADAIAAETITDHVTTEVWNGAVDAEWLGFADENADAVAVAAKEIDTGPVDNISMDTYAESCYCTECCRSGSGCRGSSRGYCCKFDCQCSQLRLIDV